MSDALKNLARSALARAFAFALASRSEPYVPAAGPVLVIAPHPDDETLGCGGLIALHASRNDPVHVIFLTDGEASHDGHPQLTRDELRTRRRNEALAALDELGLPPHDSATFLSAPDGALDRLDPAETRRLTTALTERISATCPAVVLAPYLHGGSSEHTAACELAAQACALAGGATLLEYPIWAWWNAFRLRPRLARGADNLRLELSPWRECKQRALALHRTQIAPVSPWRQAVLPAAITRACCGAHEFFFRRQIGAGGSDDFRLSARGL